MTTIAVRKPTVDIRLWIAVGIMDSVLDRTDLTVRRSGLIPAPGLVRLRWAALRVAHRVRLTALLRRALLREVPATRVVADIPTAEADFFQQ